MYGNYAVSFTKTLKEAQDGSTITCQKHSTITLRSCLPQHQKWSQNHLPQNRYLDKQVLSLLPTYILAALSEIEDRCN